MLHTKSLCTQSGAQTYAWTLGDRAEPIFGASANSNNMTYRTQTSEKTIEFKQPVTGLQTWLTQSSIKNDAILFVINDILWGDALTSHCADNVCGDLLHWFESLRRWPRWRRCHRHPRGQQAVGAMSSNPELTILETNLPSVQGGGSSMHGFAAAAIAGGNWGAVIMGMTMGACRMLTGEASDSQPQPAMQR